MLGFILIVIWYSGIGLLAALGAISISRKLFAPRGEQLFYAAFLILFSVFYLSFVSYFQQPSARPLETWAVLGFILLALLGTRLPFLLVAGYCLHGAWDLLHELHVHAGHSAFEPGQLTAIPLAYGFFCSVFDFSMAAYFYKRRADWKLASR
jgi:hypothetical protein